MGAVDFWTVNQDGDDIVDVCIRDNRVCLEIPRILDTTVRTDLTPAKAEELARDLRAAARLARRKS